MNDQDVCETGACQIIGRPVRTAAGLSTSTVLARIMTALDHATEWERMQVFDVLNARGFDEELTAGDVLQVCVALELPAGAILSTLQDDARGFDYVAGLHANGIGDLN